ncbi:hypothetical protein FB446DRAFT_530901 [Lentinula raphanica]|nr:hypothetical protein FB446DRAFT_530901 [Lentinula raphanica]
MPISSTSVVLSALSVFLATINPTMAMPVDYGDNPHETVLIPYYHAVGLAIHSSGYRKGTFVIKFATESTEQAESQTIDLRSALYEELYFSDGGVRVLEDNQCALHVVGPKVNSPKLITGILPLDPHDYAPSNPRIQWTWEDPYHSAKLSQQWTDRYFDFHACIMRGAYA